MVAVWSRCCDAPPRGTRCALHLPPEGYSAPWGSNLISWWAQGVLGGVKGALWANRRAFPYKDLCNFLGEESKDKVAQYETLQEILRVSEIG